MRGIAIDLAEELVLSAIVNLNNGNIDNVLACFAEEFMFTDCGIGLEFTNKDLLSEFFSKTRELYPDSRWQTTEIFLSDDTVITEWTLEFTLTEPFYGRLSRKVQVSIQGASIVRVGNGKIINWVDYDDGLASRRIALASYFKEWIEA